MATKSSCSKDFSSKVESAIINNQVEQLEELLLQTDINMCMNQRQDSPLLLAVKLSRCAVVEALLASPGCDLAHQNINYYSPLDLALVMAYDNQKEPRQKACWQILEMLLTAGAEPASPDAMLYVIRTAFKVCDDTFILRLVNSLVKYSSSLDIHTLLLIKLHRNQPLYSGDTDHLFIQAANFTMKLIKLPPSGRIKDLPQIVACLPYFFDSYWESKELRENLFIKLIVFLTSVGWKWTNRSDLDYIANVSHCLSQWCRQQCRSVPSLLHICRLTLMQSPTSRKLVNPSKIPVMLFNFLNFQDIEELMPLSPTYEFNCIRL